MPVNTIGDINLREAELKAQGVEAGPRALRTLGSDVGSGISGALKSAEVLQENELNKQKQKEADALLASGVEGVVQYTQELGIEDSTVYRKMAETAKSPKDLVGIYALAKKKADKDASDAKRAEGAQQLSGSLVGIRQKISDGSIKNDDFDSLLVSLEQMAAGSIGDKPLTDQINKTIDDVRALKEKTATKTEKELSAGESVRSVDSLRKEIASQTKEAKKSIQFADKAITLGKAALASPGGLNTSSDVAMIMAFNKLLDPGSVVREGEYDRTEKTQGVFNWLKGYVNSMKESGGAKLTDTARRNIMKSMQSMQRLYKLNLLEEKAGGGMIALRRGQLVQDVIPDITREEMSILENAHKNNELITENSMYNEKRKQYIKEAMDAAYAAVAEAQKDEAKFMYKGPNMLSDIMQKEGLDASYLATTGIGQSVNTAPEQEGIMEDFSTTGTTPPTVKTDNEGFTDVGGGYSFKVIKE